MKFIVSLSLLFSVLLLGFVVLDLAVVISQYNKHLAEPYDLYSWFGVSVVGGVISLTCASSWLVLRKSKGMTLLWQKAALLQFVIPLIALAILLFIFVGPYATVRV
jgi:hypothetical protein